MDQALLLRAVDMVESLATHLIVLATGLVVLVMLFSKWLGPSQIRRPYKLLSTAIFTLLLSIVFGIATLMTLAGNIAYAGGGAPDGVQLAEPPLLYLSIYRGNVRLMSFLQVVSFGAGLILLIVFMLRVQPEGATRRQDP